MKWVIQNKRADFEKITETFQISPITARILANRNLTDIDTIRFFLDGKLKDLPDPSLLKDMDLGVMIIEEAIKKEKKIRVIGDYDIDGVCSTAILKRGISQCGGKVDSAIPHRMKDGYGLNENLILDALEDGIEVIITCDNGIAAFEAVKIAVLKGMTVVITDHHQIQDSLPEADAVINPQRKDSEYPFRGICGAEVAYFFVQKLYEKFNLKEEQDLLELAAFATIGDVMDLEHVNRVLVREGLRSMERTKNPGLKALKQIYNIQGKLSPFHIGFLMGPCINAAGRLDTAAESLKLLEADDISEAAIKASNLKDLNENRKEMTLKAVKEAEKLVEEKGFLQDKILVVYLPECHESLAGIVAGRLREAYKRPAFVLTNGEEGLKGSGRSVESYHMYEGLLKCRDLFLKFGGHSQAAGLSMERNNLEIFRQRINEHCLLSWEDMEEKLKIDLILPFSMLQEKLIRELEILEPYGKGNSRPLFAVRNAGIKKVTLMGKEKNMGKFVLEDENKDRMEMVSFSNTMELKNALENEYGTKIWEKLLRGEDTPVKVSFAYYPEINEFAGRRTIQIRMVEFLINKGGQE